MNVALKAWPYRCAACYRLDHGKCRRVNCVCACNVDRLLKRLTNDTRYIVRNVAEELSKWRAAAG